MEGEENALRGYRRQAQEEGVGGAASVGLALPKT